jgi:hypothetical protein
VRPPSTHESQYTRYSKKSLERIADVTVRITSSSLINYYVSIARRPGTMVIANRMGLTNLCRLLFVYLQYYYGILHGTRSSTRKIQRSLFNFIGPLLKLFFWKILRNAHGVSATNFVLHIRFLKISRRVCIFHFLILHHLVLGIRYFARPGLEMPWSFGRRGGFGVSLDISGRQRLSRRPRVAL